LKYIFVIISFIFIVLVIYNNSSLKTEITSNQALIEDRDFSSVTQVLHGPKFLGVDKKKQPFKVMARKATRFKKSPDIFNLEYPTGEMNSGEEKFFLSGDIGIFNKEVQILKVKGNVILNDENDMEFNTSEMDFDFKEEILFGNKKVEGKKNNSYIVSEGFKIFNKGEKIFFMGKTKLILEDK
tara:strand:+ start:504 stop:1052 length:549 start_codon:yes stop_codon:yes gene_type:complete